MCKKIARKKLTKATLWTFEWLKINHIFISPYHNHFWWISNFYFLNMYIKYFLEWLISYGLFSLLTTM